MRLHATDGLLRKLGAALLLAGCASNAAAPVLPAASPRARVDAKQLRDALYVSDYLRNDILVFPAGEAAGNQPPLETISVGGIPQGLWVDDRGILYAVVGSSVEEFKPGATRPFFSLANGMHGPIAVAVDRNRTVYVSDEEKTKVGILEYPAGKTSPARVVSLSVPKTIFAFAGGLAFDGKGDLYATAFFYNIPPAHVYRIERGTSKVTDLGLTGVGNEAGLAADASGNLYVGNENGGINVYRAGESGYSRTIDVGTQGPSLFAVTRQGQLYVPYQFGETGSLLEYAAGGGQPVNALTGDYLSEPVGAALRKESL